MKHDRYRAWGFTQWGFNTGVGLSSGAVLCHHGYEVLTLIVGVVMGIIFGFAQAAFPFPEGETAPENSKQDTA
jgi:hypothetical protein